MQRHDSKIPKPGESFLSIPEKHADHRGRSHSRNHHGHDTLLVPVQEAVDGEEGVSLPLPALSHRGRSLSKHSDKSRRDAGVSRHRSVSRATKHNPLEENEDVAALRPVPPVPLAAACSRALSESKTHDPFTMLEVGKEYKVENFTGSCPTMAGIHLRAITNDGNFPIFKHENCFLKVVDIDHAGQRVSLDKKCLRLTATVLAAVEKGQQGPGGNCSYGITGTYIIEVVLMKNAAGQVICTSMRGLEGKINIPTLLSGPLAITTVATGIFVKPRPWNEVLSYNTGSKQQKLPVNLTYQHGKIGLETIIDPNLLELDGSAWYMLRAVNMVGMASPAVLAGAVAVKPCHCKPKGPK